MKLIRLFMTIVYAFTTLNALAQYTCYVGGDDIKLYAPPTNYSRYPDLFEVRWNVKGGGTNVVTLIGNTVNPVTVRPVGAGTVTISCSATYYDKTLSNYTGKTTVTEDYTVTCIDNTGGGSGGGGGNSGGDSGSGSDTTPGSVGSYFQDYTKEGLLMLFMVETYSGEKCATVVPSKIGSSCIGSANGKVTIPSSAKGLTVKGIGSAAFKSLSGLTELIIPSTVTTVNTNAIYLCENITSVTCEATTPPAYIGSSQICNIDYKCVLYVPKGCVSKYESASGWKRFGAIKEIGSSEEQIKLTANPTGGEIEKGKTVTLNTDVSGADIYYTTNNTTPSKTNGTKYSTPITINQSLTLRAIAYKVGYKNSNELKETYTVKTTVDPTSISVSPSSKTIKVGDTFTIDYTLAPTNATTTVTWSSDNNSVASVNQSTRKVTGVKAGTTYIRAATSNGKTASCKVTVEEATVAPTSISVSPSSKTIKVGETFTPTYTITPSNATTTVTWSSDNSNVASVDKTTGKVTGIKAGNTYINATTSNGKTNWCKVTVEGVEPAKDVVIDETNFPDENFRNYLLRQDYGKDGVITKEEIKEITFMDVILEDISSLKGIEHFIALTWLECGINKLKTLDVSKNTALMDLSCDDNQLTTLDVSQNIALKYLTCSSNQLTVLDVSKNMDLIVLSCEKNQLTNLDVSNHTKLTSLPCYLNNLKSLNVSGCTSLEYLTCYSNQLSSLDVSKNTALIELRCDNNQLTTLDVSKNTALTTLDCDHNQLTTLDVSKNTALIKLDCTYNHQLTTLDVSKNTALIYLGCDVNQLTTLDVSKNTVLEYLGCGVNRLTTLDVSKNTALTSLYCSNNQLTALDVSKNTALIYLHCDDNQLTTLDVSKNTALEYLFCSNNQLTALDVSKKTALTSLVCDNNQLATLDVSKNTALVLLYCERNHINGKAMDALIGSLPQHSAIGFHGFYVYDNSESDEGNVCTKSQVTAAKAKGWTPFYRNPDNWPGSWVEYEGSDDEPTEPISITLPEMETVNVNSTIQLTPTIEPADAVTELTWSSDDESIAKVTSKGLVAGIKSGTAIISVRTSNGLFAECFVIVQDPSSIHEITTDGNVNAPIYNLSGQKVTNVKKGIYIINGKKVVVK